METRRQAHAASLVIQRSAPSSVAMLTMQTRSILCLLYQHPPPRQTTAQLCRRGKPESLSENVSKLRRMPANSRSPSVDLQVGDFLVNNREVVVQLIGLPGKAPETQPIRSFFNLQADACRCDGDAVSGRVRRSTHEWPTRPIMSCPSSRMTWSAKAESMASRSWALSLEVVREQYWKIGGHVGTLVFGGVVALLGAHPDVIHTVKWQEPTKKLGTHPRVSCRCTPDMAASGVRVLQNVGGRWKMVILFQLFARPVLRFSSSNARYGRLAENADPAVARTRT